MSDSVQPGNERDCFSVEVAMIEIPKPQRMYRDKKGNVYLTKGEARHTVTGEHVVILQTVAGDHLGPLRVMPYDDFYDGETEVRGNVQIRSTTMEELPLPCKAPDRAKELEKALREVDEVRHALKEVVLHVNRAAYTAEKKAAHEALDELVSRLKKPCMVIWKR